MKPATFCFFASSSIFFSFALTPPASGQSEAVLRSFFEGKRVVVKMDMPGDKSGVDIHPESSQPLDYPKIGDRLREYGVALYRGDAVMVTLVKVKKKNIEFHLGGGGSRGVSVPYISTFVPKSNREKRLEDEYDRETDPARKRRLNDDLEDERRRRRYERERLEAEAEQAKLIAKASEPTVRARGGSRFNLWYERGVPLDALTPESMMRALADYVEFRFEANLAAETAMRNLPNPLLLRKGMTEDEVNALFGLPETRSVEQAASLDVIRCDYLLDAAKLSVQFVEGVLVQYVLTSQ